MAHSLRQKEGSGFLKILGNLGAFLERRKNRLPRIQVRASEITYRICEKATGRKLEKNKGRFSWAFLTARDGRDRDSSLLSFIPSDGGFFFLI